MLEVNSATSLDADPKSDQAQDNERSDMTYNEYSWLE